MKKTCPKCKGTGSFIVDTKECEVCGGTGYEDNSFEMKGHFKGVNSKAAAKFDLDADQDVPCEACKGKGTVDIQEECPKCHGSGEINVCGECGVEIEEGENYCDDCKAKFKQEKKTRTKTKVKVESDISGKEIVYELDGLCDINDLELNSIYKGRVTKIERFGIFISLNNQVWGLMRVRNSRYKVGDTIFARISEIKEKKHEVDMAPAHIQNGEYVIKKVKKNIKRTKIGTFDDKSIKKFVKVYGEVLQIQQTSGPTIFIVSDETSIVEVAAFDEPGVRMYPEIEVGDMVSVIGEVNQRNGKIQIESSSIEKMKPVLADKMREIIDKALDIKAEPADTTDKISFASSNDLVATVSSSGNVKAIGAGEAVITITCGEITKECKVICNFGTPVDPTVPSTDPTQNVPADFVLKLNREDFTLSNEGEKWTLYTETNGVKASDITWTVDDPAVAIVENGRVTAVNYGDTQVHATIGDQTVSCWVRVRFYAATEGEGEEEGEKLKLNKTDVTIKVDETFTLTLTNSEGVKMNVEFTANEEGYVTIDGGRITGAKGTADLADKYVVVSATYEDVTYSCKVRVTEPKTDE